jgi:hypothetical protein
MVGPWAMTYLITNLREQIAKAQCSLLHSLTTKLAIIILTER